MMFLLGYIAAPPTILVISAEATPDMHAPARKTVVASAIGRTHEDRNFAVTLGFSFKSDQGVAAAGRSPDVAGRRAQAPVRRGGEHTPRAGKRGQKELGRRRQAVRRARRR